MAKRLGIGIVGSGFNAKFHLLGFVGVRDADVLGVWSPNQKNAAPTATIAKKLGVGDAKPHPSIAAMVEDPAIDAIWLCGSNHVRIENVEEMVSAIERGKGKLLGVACEKPLARNVAEAKRVVELVKKVGLPTGYLENQVFAPQVEVGRTLLWARGGRAPWPACPLVLAGRATRGRRAERHDVSLVAAGPTPAHRPDETADLRPAGENHGPHRESQVVPPPLQQEAQRGDGAGRGLREDAVRGFCERGDRFRHRRRPSRAG